MNSLEKMTLFLSKNNQERYLFYTQEYPYHPRHNSHFVGNKAKGRISKRMLQENKARQIFRKRSISYPQEIFVVWKILLALFSCNTRFENLTFALLPFALGQLNSRVLRKKNYSWGIVNLWRKWFILLLIFVDILHENLGTNDIFQLSL